jgi:hypothetical protein
MTTSKVFDARIERFDDVEQGFDPHEQSFDDIDQEAR